MIINYLCESYITEDFISKIGERILTITEAENTELTNNISTELKTLASLYLALLQLKRIKYPTKPDSVKKAISKFKLNIPTDELDTHSNVRIIAGGDKDKNVEAMFTKDEFTLKDFAKIYSVDVVGNNRSQIRDVLIDLIKRDPSVLTTAKQMMEFIKDEDAETKFTISTFKQGEFVPSQEITHNPRRSSKALSHQQLQL
jgi:hypothetical protein